MRMPPFDRYVKGMQMLGVFMLGMVAGAILLNMLFVAEFESSYRTRNDLESKLEQYEHDLQNLKQFKDQHTVIKSVQLRIYEDNHAHPAAPRLDKMTETELVKLVKEDLSILLGRSIYDIDSDAKLARKLLERKVYRDVNGKDYLIELKTVLLAENVLQIWMTARIYVMPPAS